MAPGLGGPGRHRDGADFGIWTEPASRPGLGGRCGELRRQAASVAAKARLAAGIPGLAAVAADLEGLAADLELLGGQLAALAADLAAVDDRVAAASPLWRRRPVRRFVLWLRPARRVTVTAEDDGRRSA